VVPPAQPTATSPDDLVCPSDRELLRATDRDAFDRAYGRAWACVERELAKGRTWRDLGR
jgi:hypothetical protein